HQSVSCSRGRNPRACRRYTIGFDAAARSRNASALRRRPRSAVQCRLATPLADARPAVAWTSSVPPPLPGHLPIVAARMRAGVYRPVYEEREVTERTDLCDARGRLNPAAVGWSRTPLVRANLVGHWPRKKRWNFWNWISPQFVFSVTLADIDYAAFCQMSF